MATIHPGRYTARTDGDFVVFLIGMRINRPLRIHKWLPVFIAMCEAVYGAPYGNPAGADG